MAKNILILTDSMGRGDAELGRLLLKNFIYSLARNEVKPAAVMFMNEGVRLACEGSESLDDLALLVENGVAVKACGTCLDYLGLKDALRVGIVGTMPGAVETFLSENEVVTIA